MDVITSGICYFETAFIEHFWWENWQENTGLGQENVYEIIGSWRRQRTK